MSDTPKTDLFMGEQHFAGLDYEQKYHRCIEFARALERELKKAASKVCDRMASV